MRRLPLVLIVAMTIFSMLAQPVAAATASPPNAPEGQYLWWTLTDRDYTVFQQNEFIQFEFAKMANIANCFGDGINDPITPFTDVYVLHSPTEGRPEIGAGLVDVSGLPNTYQADSPGGEFTSYGQGPVAATLPIGNLGAGDYAMAFDECQDGKLGLEDYYNHYAFTVKIDYNAPDVDWTARNTLKGNFLAAKREMESSRDYINSLALIKTVQDLSRQLRKRPTYQQIIATLPVRLPRGAGKKYTRDLVSMFQTARMYDALAADPPDPAFRQPTPLEPRDLSETTNRDPIDVAIANFDSAVQNEYALAKALLHSIERYQGADIAQDGEWALIHGRASQLYLEQLAANGLNLESGAAALADAIAADSDDLEALSAELEAARLRVVAQGFSADEVREAHNAGMSDADLAQLRADLATASYAYDESDTLAALAGLRSATQGLRAELVSAKAEMDAIVAAIEAAPQQVNPRLLRPDAGGPYAAVEGQPVALSAAATANAPAPFAQYEWDLDADGAFDDATGAQVTHTFTSALRGHVGVRVTNTALGISAVDYAPLTVQNANSRPDVSLVEPDGAAVILEAGQTQRFAVTAADPDGDAVAIQWLLNGSPVASGPAFTYTPAEADVGVQQLEARVSDGQATGGAVLLSWRVDVRGYDQDGDGWTRRQGADCDDSDPAVNPGQDEVLGNGKDDDCDPNTTDKGGPPAVAFTPQSGGRNVALYEGGATVSAASSSISTNLSPRQMVDYATSEAWTTGTGKVANEWAVIALAGGKEYLLDRIKLMPAGTSQGVRNFELAVSTSSATGPFTTVLAGTAANSETLQEFLLPTPVKARYVRLAALNNYGSANGITIKQLKVYTAQEGGPTVSFANRSVDSENDIVKWAWSFGDGATSAEASPTHTYASAAATYNVTLTATDSQGHTASYSLPQRVLLPPAVSLSHTAPREAFSTNFTDTSVDPDGGTIVGARLWSWGDGKSSSPTAKLASHTYTDSGTYEVTLTVVDSQEQQATGTYTLVVPNTPPTATVNGNQTLVWGQNLDVSATIVNDDSEQDRKTLTCVWAWGDGQSTPVAGKCDNATVKVLHAYANPGTYTAALTVNDKDGGAATAKLTATVIKRDLFVQPLSVTPVAGGQVEIVARVSDAYSWEPMDGRVVTFTAGAATATATTKDGGLAKVVMPRPASVTRIGVSVPGDTHYNPFGMERRILAPRGDIVFIIDESGSMDADQEDVQRNLTTMAAQLASRVDFRIGLVGFGAAINTHGTPQPGAGHMHLPLNGDVQQVARGLDAFVTNGGDEVGFDGVVVGMGDALGFRPNAGACAVLITDDDNEDTTKITTTKADAIAAIKRRNALFMGIVAPGHLGTDVDYGPNPGSLAAETGGQIWSIYDFRKNPQPILDAIVERCVAHIARPDLAVTIGDGLDTAAQGDTVTYTVSVANGSTGIGYGTVIEAALPAGAALVSASDGGALVGGKLRWPALDLIAGETATRTFSVRLDGPFAAGAQLVATASAADDGLSGADPTPANNSASDTTGVSLPANQAPAAQAQAATTDEGAAVAITLAAADPDGDALSYAVASQPQHGTLSGQAPNLTYTPAAGFSGSDSFTFTASDGALTSAPATVSISVLAVNDAPSVGAGGPYSVDEGGAVLLAAAGADPEGEPLSYAWDLDGDGSFETDGQSVMLAAAGLDGPGSVTVSVRATDVGGLSAVAQAEVELVNVAPTAVLMLGADSVAAGERFTVALVDFADAALADREAGFQFAFDCGDGYGPAGAENRVNCIATGAGQLTVRGKVIDKDGGASEYSATIMAEAMPPAVAAPVVAPSPSDEGAAVTASASFTPRGSDAPYTCTVDYGAGPVAGTVAGELCQGPAHTYADNGSHQVTVRVVGASGAWGEGAAAHSVANLAPAVGAITAPEAPVALGGAVAVQASFTDAGLLDTHTAIWAWGDGSTSAASLGGGAGAGTAAGSHSYAEAGVYRVTLTVTDKDGGVGSATSGYVVVYDPSGGFVTGGGFIESPAGAYTADPSLGGRANFGFVAKYRKGASVPTGETEFQFKLGGLNFHSASYEWLVVAGAKAQFKGAGIVNGAAGYGFMLTAVDGQRQGGGGTDRFRIKIWEQATGRVVYDNQLGAGDDAAPTTALTGGAITVHAK